MILDAFRGVSVIGGIIDDHIQFMNSKAFDHFRGRILDDSDIEIRPLYTAADIPEKVTGELPGKFPFTRGIQPDMYRGKLWTMRQFAGFSSPAETNKRFKLLLAQGQTGLSTAFDMPTLMGYDADSPKGQGEVGKCGVSISSIEDMEVIRSVTKWVARAPAELSIADMSRP